MLDLLLSSEVGFLIFICLYRELDSSPACSECASRTTSDVPRHNSFVKCLVRPCDGRAILSCWQSVYRACITAVWETSGQLRWYVKCARPIGPHRGSRRLPAGPCHEGIAATPEWLAEQWWNVCLGEMCRAWSGLDHDGTYNCVQCRWQDTPYHRR